jgi:hypothetical protein
MSDHESGGEDERGEVRVDDPGHLAGVPDEFQRLWTPHRMVYIQKGQQPDRDECPFCIAPSMTDEDALIVARGEHAYVLLNLFPYNSGHLLVCPYRHIATYDLATPEEVAERRLQHRHEPGPGGGRRHRRAPAPAHRAEVGAGRELPADHREDQGAAAAAGRRARIHRRSLARPRG